MTFDMSNRRDYNMKSPTDATWERAQKRLDKGEPTQTGADTWLVPGIPEMGDEYESYTVKIDGTTFQCECYQHGFGASRLSKICSHAAMVSLFTGLLCERAEVLPAPLPEAPVLAPTAQILTVPDHPCDIHGIPAKYDTWRPYQKETVEWALEQVRAGQKIITLDAPCGSGKTLTSMALVRLLNTQALYICSTRNLQEQMYADFKADDVAVIWGRSNYRCLKSSELTAEDCTHSEDSPCLEIGRCSYKIAKRVAIKARVAILNYAYALNELNHVGRFSKRPLMILDEGDLCESEIMRYVSLAVTRKQLDACHIQPPEFKTKFESWIEWAKETLPKVQKEMEPLQMLIESYEGQEEPPISIVHEAKRYERLITKLDQFTHLVNDSWVAEIDDENSSPKEKWEFKPAWVKDYGKEQLLDHAGQVIAMSGTMPPGKDWAYWLGGDVNDVVSKQVPCWFPKENRPFIYWPVANFGKKFVTPEDLKKLAETVDRILIMHPGEKGLVHTVSYDLAKYICEHTVHQDRIISHTSATRLEALEQLINSETPLVLVSPSMTRGVDLFGDRAGFQILCKLAFGNLGDKQISKRRWSGRSGERWYLLETARTIVQSQFRVIRGPEDNKPTYCLDTRWPEFYDQVERDLPEYFKEGCQW